MCEINMLGDGVRTLLAPPHSNHTVMAHIISTIKKFEVDASRTVICFMIRTNDTKTR